MSTDRPNRDRMFLKEATISNMCELAAIVLFDRCPSYNATSIRNHLR